MKKLSLTVKISLGLVLGVIIGTVFENYSDFVIKYIKPIGTIYLNLIKMIVVPVVLFSIIQGTISLKDIKKVGVIGVRCITFYLFTTAFAITLGLLTANLLNVGNGYKLPDNMLTYEETTIPNFMDTIVNIFPSNAVEPLVSGTMLQVIVIAIFFSFGIILAGEKGKLSGKVIESFAESSYKVMELIIGFAPFGVFALIAPVISENGPSVLIPLLKVVITAYIAYLLHTAVVYSLAVGIFGKLSPLKFFKNMTKPMLFAFSSASSVGTLPFNMEAAENLGVKKETYSFVLPLGATVNMDGTAIYQGVCAVFIAQIFGIDLSISQQLTIILTSTLASIGTAGVPGSGMIMLAMVLQSVGLPLEGIGLVAGIDRILDMGRTVVNVTGDCACCIVVDKV